MKHLAADLNMKIKNNRFKKNLPTLQHFHSDAAKPVVSFFLGNNNNKTEENTMDGKLKKDVRDIKS